MADLRTERLGPLSQVSDNLTPEPRRESDNRKGKRPRRAKPPSLKPLEDQDDTPHELDELA